jgi:uncharacterized membrane protein YfcA
MGEILLSSIFIQALFLLLSGALAGFLAGLLGIGGGVVLVPCLFYGFVLLGFDPDVMMHVAVGTSFAIIVPTGLSAARAHFKKGAVDFDLMKKLAAGVLIGVAIGTAVAGNISGKSLQFIFAFAVMFLSVVMVIDTTRFSLAKAVPGFPFNLLAGGFIGFVSSLLGIGGATISVPFMTLCSVNIHKAVGTASALGLVISIPALLGFIYIGIGQEGLPPFSLGYICLPAFFLIVPVSVFFAPYGAFVAHRVSVKRLKTFFAVFLIIVAINMMYSAFSGGV